MLNGRIGEIALILMIVFIMFGAGKLPRVMEDIAKGIKAFKQGMHNDIDNKDD